MSDLVRPEGATPRSVLDQALYCGRRDSRILDGLVFDEAFWDEADAELARLSRENADNSRKFDANTAALILASDERDAAEARVAELERENADKDEQAGEWREKHRASETDWRREVLRREAATARVAALETALGEAHAAMCAHGDLHEACARVRVALVGEQTMGPTDEYGWIVKPPYTLADNPGPSGSDFRRAEAAEAMLRGGIEAMRLTREYVGEDVLPAVRGWSWFDWSTRAAALVGEQTAEPKQPIKPIYRCFTCGGWPAFTDFENKCSCPPVACSSESDETRGEVQASLKADYPRLWDMAGEFDYEERIGRGSSPLHAEADRVMRELYDARRESAHPVAAPLPADEPGRERRQ